MEKQKEYAANLNLQEMKSDIIKNLTYAKIIKALMILNKIVFENKIEV